MPPAPENKETAVRDTLSPFFERPNSKHLFVLSHLHRALSRQFVYTLLIYPKITGAVLGVFFNPLFGTHEEGTAMTTAGLEFPITKPLEPLEPLIVNPCKTWEYA
jgi:hypothetical protein